MAATGYSHPFGKSENLLRFGEGKSFVVDDEALDRLFLHEEVKHRKIITISIIGAFRQGKSFFLDYCLRFLYANYESLNNPDLPVGIENWVGDENEPLKGFSWKSGSKPDTTGIIMWSDVFLHTIANTGEKVAIFVMDTQGLFDHNTSATDNSRIFALSTLISSTQILNLSGMIREDQLQYLQFATEFARFAAQDNQNSTNKPFQNLLFLIRDWSYPDDHPFGKDGGKTYLNEVLQIKSNHETELKSVREFIMSSFDQVSCFLMPDPGKTVVRGKQYDGGWKQMDEEFKEELVNAIEMLLMPENLVLKKINSIDLKGFEVRDYIQTYLELFQSEKLPPTQSIYESTIEKQMSILIQKCIDFYRETIYNNRDLLTEENHHVFHEYSKIATLQIFSNEKKMGNVEHEKKFKAELETDLDDLYLKWRDEMLENLEKIKEEKRKTEEALQEKFKLEQEALEAERTTKEKQQELERQKQLQLVENEKYEAERKVLESRMEAEKERANAIESEKKAQEAFRKVLEEKLNKEQLLNAEKEKQAELERKQQLQIVANAKLEAERKAVQLQLEAEQERAKAVQAEKNAQEELRKALEQQLKNEQLSSEQKVKEAELEHKKLMQQKENERMEADMRARALDEEAKLAKARAEAAAEETRIMEQRYCGIPLGI